MQKVDIYIDTYHTGNLKKGTGTYSIILEYMTSKNFPITKDYIEGARSTTKNRTALIACISALKHMNRPCDIRITINSEYITQAINTNAWFEWLNTGKNAKGKPVKNMDLWQQLFELVDQHHTEFIFSERNSYSDCMYRELQKRNVDYKEDVNNV